MAQKGRVTKVVLVDKDQRPIAASSQQVPEDPFTYGANGLAEPPYNPENLLNLAEKHPTHGASIEQKTSDIAGTGWHWVKEKEDAEDEQRQKLDAWLRGLADPERDETTSEIIANAWGDVESIGQGMFEIARDGEGRVQKIYSSASHMVRFHVEGRKLAQGIPGKRTWFKRWLPNDESLVDIKTGKHVTPEKASASPKFERANELLVLRRPARRSSHYGIPGYVSAIGWISLSLAARDDNIHFFNNRREPRWAIILQNIEDDDNQLETQLRDAFSTSLKEPHRNIFIPIEGPGDITFQQLSQDSKDISFDRLQERAGGEILIAHRMPPDRLGAVRVGPLGGNATVAASRVYKEAVVSTSQKLLAERVNRFIRAESGEQEVKWLWAPTELDLTEEAEDVNVVSTAWTSGLMRLDEARDRLKLPRVGSESGGDKFFFEIAAENPAAAAAASAGAAARAGGQVAVSGGTRDSEIEARNRDLSDRILQTLRPGDE